METDLARLSIESAFAQLLICLAHEDDEGLTDLICDLGEACGKFENVPDDVVESLLYLLGDIRMYESALSGHILNFFEFEAPRLSVRAKLLCADFMRAHGDRFRHVHGQQVVTELRSGQYLRQKP